jgi:hypothetical protein
MWGTSSLDDKLASDLANAIEAIQIGDLRLDRVAAGKFPPVNFGLLQQYPGQSPPLMLKVSSSRFDPGCVKTFHLQ